MPPRPRENLKIIRLNDEMLPHWAQLLDMAARLCCANPEVQRWFLRFCNENGVDDSRTILAHGRTLSAAVQEQKDSLLAQLRRSPEDEQPREMLAAWKYALDTIILEASSTPTCSWIIEGLHKAEDSPSDGGDVRLHRL